MDEPRAAPAWPHCSPVICARWVRMSRCTVTGTTRRAFSPTSWPTCPSGACADWMAHPGPPRGYETGWGRSWASAAALLSRSACARVADRRPHGDRQSARMARAPAARPLFGLSRGVPIVWTTTIRATGTFNRGGASGAALPCAWVVRHAPSESLCRRDHAQSMDDTDWRACVHGPVQLVRCGIDARGDSRGARSRPRPQHRCVCASAPERRDSGAMAPPGGRDPRRCGRRGRRVCVSL